jgi:hypothetical protein
MENKICQSCGMPLNDEKLIATKKDGRPNQDYCIYCYKDGGFTEPDITMQEMEDVCVHYMSSTEGGFRETDARKMMHVLLPTLDRWKK